MKIKKTKDNEIKDTDKKGGSPLFLIMKREYRFLTVKSRYDTPGGMPKWHHGIWLIP